MSDWPTKQPSRGFLARLKRRGVLRVAASYALIAWLLLQIGDVVLDPFDGGDAIMRVLLILVALGFPVALVLAWFFELTPQGVELDRLEEDVPRPAVTGIRRYADIIIIGALVAVIAFLLAREGGLVEGEPAEPVLAVLPFSNLSADTQYEYFGEGLADTLIHKLGQLNELVVLASQSTFQFKGRNLNLDDVGGKLGATSIMTGSVQRAGNTLRINARLMEVGTGRQLWAGSFDRNVQDVFAIQDEIAGAVTDALHLVLTPQSKARVTRQDTVTLTAYDAYVLGSNHLAIRGGETTITALEYFKQAIQEDPEYALAYAGVVEAYHLMQSWPEPHDWKTNRDEAARAAEQAMALNPELGEAWLARAIVAGNDQYYLGIDDVPTAEILALYEKAVALSPNNAVALKYYANALRDAGKKEQGFEMLQRAARLDPRSGIIRINIGETFQQEGEFEQAEHWFLQAVHSREPYFKIGFLMLIRLHTWHTRRLDEAARWGREWLDVYPENWRGFRATIPVMLDLELWNEADRLQQMLDEQAAQFEKPDHMPWDLWRYAQLLTSARIERVKGNLDAAAKLSRTLSAEIWELADNWPVLQDYGSDSWGAVTLALHEIQAGQPEQALQRMQAAYPGGFEVIDRAWLDPLHPPVIIAALHKLTGQEQEGRELLQSYLAHVRGLLEQNTIENEDWTPFIILALLGEKEAALDELEKIIDSGYVHDWWALEELAFDPDYAQVIADPRFQSLQARISARVNEMRESYLARPNLPPGSIP